MRFFICGVLLCPFFALAEPTIVGVSAKIVFPAQIAAAIDLPKLSMAWSPECAKVQRDEDIVFRKIAGAVSMDNLTCDSEAPESVEAWDTVAVQFGILGRLWTFELRESAQIELGIDSDAKIRLDMEPLKDERADKLMLKNVHITYAPGEKGICSAEMFGVSVRIEGPRLVKSDCYIDSVVWNDADEGIEMDPNTAGF